MPRASALTTADLDKYYKDTAFGAMPGGVGTQYSPRPGVQVFRDAEFGMAHIYGDTRSDVMFGVGYATAEERLFAMDALRHAAKGTLAELTGPAGAEMDRQQLTDQDFTDEELRKQFNDLPEKFGEAGVRGQQDVLDYIAGINARIDDVKSDPTILPAEYAALNVMPAEWDTSDTVAMAVLLVTQFTVSNGGEERNAHDAARIPQALRQAVARALQRLPHARRPRDVHRRSARASLRPAGQARAPGVNVIPDLGSIKGYNPQTAGSGAASAGADRAVGPPRVAFQGGPPPPRLERRRRRLALLEDGQAAVGRRPTGLLLVAADLRRVRASRRRTGRHGRLVPRREPLAADRARHRLRLERHERERGQPGHVRRMALRARRLGAHGREPQLHVQGRVHARSASATLRSRRRRPQPGT